MLGKKEYWEKLQLRHLLTMQSGVAKEHLMYFDRRKGIGAEDYSEYMMCQELQCEPGTQYKYSSGDAIMAGVW